VLPLLVAVVFAGLFVLAERRAEQPLIDAKMFDHLNFTASTVSQLIAGMLELGLGYLLPFYLLLVVGVGPVTAGLVLIPAPCRSSRPDRWPADCSTASAYAGR